MTLPLRAAMLSSVKFSPALLFAGGEVGAWFDPSDITTLFQDSAGTTPVTAVEQPVGLILDKSKNLAIGSDMVTNGGFAADANWTKGVGWSIGSGVATKTAGTQDDLFQTASLVAGKTYIITFTITRTAGFFRMRFLNGTPVQSPAYSTSGTYTVYLTAVTGNNVVSAFGDAAFAGTVDDISMKLLDGNHASQATAASRPVLSARYNLLTYTEDFTNVVWAGASLTMTANSTTAPDGTTTAETATRTATGSAENNVRYTTTQAVSTAYTYTCHVKAGSAGAKLYLRNIAVDSGATNGVVHFDPSNGTISLTFGSTYTGNATMTSVGNGWYRCTIKGTTPGTIATNFLDVGVTNGSTATGGTAGDFIYIWGADLRPTNDGVNLPPYQRVVTGTTNDYDTAGFPPYLKFDGVDDSLATASIDFSATDKMTVFAGVRKLADTTFGIIAELSAASGSNAGSFYIDGPEGAAANFGFYSRGSVAPGAPVTATGYAAPITTVLSGLGDIATPGMTIRGNGVQGATSTTSQGTGTYGNYPMYIGRRGSTTFPFNGRLYSLIVRGAASSADQITRAETWVNGKTGAF